MPRFPNQPPVLRAALRLPTASGEGRVSARQKDTIRQQRKRSDSLNRWTNH